MRGGGRKAAAAAAIAVLTLLLGFLLREGPREAAHGGGDGPGKARGGADAEGDPEAPGGERGGGAARGPGGGAVPGGTETAEVPEAARVPGVAVLEDGSPLAGVRFHDRDGWMIEADVVHDASDGEGRFAVPDGSFVVPHHPHATAIAVEGAVLDEADRSVAVRAPGPIRITFRDKPGLALVRLVDADTGRPITEVESLQVRWRLPGGWLSMGYSREAAPGGWIGIPEGRLPEAAGELRADPEKVEVGFALPGYEEARAPLPELKGRREFRVRPVPPDVRGTLKAHIAPSLSSRPPVPSSITADLRWAGPDPAPSDAEVLGLPRKDGPFALYAVPPGPWVLEVAGTYADSGTVRGKVAFTAGGGTVDVGTVVLQPAGTVAVRVTDIDGTPIPQAWAVVVRPGEAPEQGRRLDLDDSGRAAVGDLEPGLAHRAVVYGLPREMEQEVVAEVARTTLMFTWPERLVPCRIRLLVERRAVADPAGKGTIPATVQESPLPRHRGTWHPDGTFEAPLVPGTYRFAVLATPKEGGAAALFAGSVTVPAGDAFETALELEREAR
jgi:hypothetical protein